MWTVPGIATANLPKPPAIPLLNTPDDLVAMHRALVEQTAALAADDESFDGSPYDSPAHLWGRVTRAVSIVHARWRRALSSGADAEALCEAALRAVNALSMVLASTSRQAADCWFDVAYGWTDQLRMHTKSTPIEPQRMHTKSTPRRAWWRFR